MSRIQTSIDSLTEATRERGEFSGHGDAVGIAGYIPPVEGEHSAEFLADPGDMTVVNPQEHGFRNIGIAMTWQNTDSAGEVRNIAQKLVAEATGHGGVDLDLGCLYELQSGERGAIQAFGKLFGKFEDKPYITLSGDDRTGNAQGVDEFLVLNGQKWPEIKRVLLYAYIYSGAPDWSAVHPKIEIRVPGEPPLKLAPKAHDGKLAVCAIASLENIRNGIKLTNHTEYFSGHPEMDRAFGYGIRWEDGLKS
jgi:tellurite resistance protein TerA